MDVAKHNSSAWDQEAERGVRWSIPVPPKEIARARAGEVKIFLTPTTPVPKEWLDVPDNAEILCLAGGGGQQAPLLATLGHVTSADNSQRQLDLDMLVAVREQLDVHPIKTNVADLSMLADGYFDLIVNPCSSCFMEDLRPVWRECVRVLRPGGTIISGHLNPVFYLTDQNAPDREARLKITRSIPHSDVTHLSSTQLSERLHSQETLEFGHTLDMLIGEQLRSGLVLIDFFEDTWSEDDLELDAFMPLLFALRAQKPS